MVTTKTTTRAAPAPRNNALVIRLTTNQRRLFERRAALSGLSTSAWARMILLRETREEESK